MALSGRLVLLAALGLLLSLLPGVVLVGYAALLTWLVVADLVLAARIADLRLHRTATDAVRLGVRTETVLSVTNTGRRTLHALVRDAWVPSAGAAPRAQRVVVPAGERRRTVTSLTPTRRGERAAAAVTVRSYGPLGVAARQRRIRVRGSLRVLPPFTSRRFLPEKLSRLRQIDGAVLTRHRGQGSEFDALRSYVPGDDVRAIDWRATARSRDVVVRTLRPERDRQVILVIDTGRSSAARIGSEPRLDAALDACLLLAAVAGRAGDRIALVAADVVIRAQLGLCGGPDILPRLVTAVTQLEPALVETDPQLLAGEVLRRASKRSLVVLFSALDGAGDDPATGSGGGLLAAAGTLAARHQLLVAAVGDPRLVQLAAGRPDAAAVYTAAAAELAAAGRRAVTDRLTRLGAVVVDSPAEVFASHVTDAYLDLKAAGRL